MVYFQPNLLLRPIAGLSLVRLERGIAHPHHQGVAQPLVEVAFLAHDAGLGISKAKE